MVSKPQKLLMDYLIALVNKKSGKKFHYIKDIHHDKKTPEKVKNELLSGNTSAKLMNYYAYKRHLRCITTNLGNLKSQRVIIFHDKNEDYIKGLLKKQGKLVEEYEELKEKLTKLEIKIATIK